MISSALSRLGKEGSFAGGVQENSAVGESQSNSRAERAVQEVEGQVRTMFHALQMRLGKRIPNTHAVLKWLVQYAGIILTKYATHDDGTTSYQQLHGKRATERLCEFGELVLFYIPKARRAKLDMAWTIGVYLGTTMT